MKKNINVHRDELKERLENIRAVRSHSEAEVSRDAIAAAVAGSRPPEPRAPLPGVSLGDPTIAERAEELLGLRE